MLVRIRAKRKDERGRSRLPPRITDFGLARSSQTHQFVDLGLGSFRVNSSRCRRLDFRSSFATLTDLGASRVASRFQAMRRITLKTMRTKRARIAQIIHESKPSLEDGPSFASLNLGLAVIPLRLPRGGGERSRICVREIAPGPPEW